MEERAKLSATAKVTISKYDECGNFIGTEQHEVKLTEEEANALWHSQQQA